MRISRWAILVITLAFVYACAESDDSEEAAEFNGVYQWADTVYGFSSEYNITGFSANQILGKPDLWPEACECPNSWAHYRADTGREYIEIGFTQHNKPASAIAIFENYTPGAVDTVYVKNPGNGSWQMVWHGTAVNIGQDTTRIFVVSFPKTSFNVTDVRMAMASDSVIGWNEYDAVAISETVFPVQYDTTGEGFFHE